MPTSSPDDQRTAWFRDARFGMFIHWGLYAIPAKGEWIRNQQKVSLEAYQTYFDEFNPTRYQPREWAALARRAGMKYAVMTAKHHDGFCLFDSKLTDYKATNTPAGRDLTREYIDAFRAEGLKVGLYYSLIDWHHPHYPVDRLHPMRDDEAFKAQQRDTSKYVDYLHGQVRELLTNYGKIDLLWFDFSYDEMSGETWRAAKLVEMIRSLQPAIILNNRLVAGHADPEKSAGLGDLSTPEQIIPADGVRNSKGEMTLWEACMTLNNHWGYASDDHHFKNSIQVVRMLVECVSKGGNLLLNVGPTALGEIQSEAVEILEDVGRWLDYNGASIYGADIAGLAKPDWGRYTRRGNILYAHVTERPMGPMPLQGISGKVTRARFLRDGSEVNTSRPWNVPKDSNDLFVNLPGISLPDKRDTVISLELAQ